MLACASRPQTPGVKARPVGMAPEAHTASAVASSEQALSEQPPSAQGMSWSYRAPPDCPSEARFLEQVAARSPALRPAPPQGVTEPRREVQVDISGGPPQEWTGRVLIDNAGEQVARAVSGASCDEVVVALALITSFWLRPRSPAAPPDTTPADLAPTPSSTGSAGSEYSSHIIGHVGYASSPAGAVRAGLRLELWGGPSASSWAAAAGLSYLSGQHDNDRLGESSLVLMLGQLDLCPPGFDAEGSLWLRPCAHVRAGALRFQAPVASLDDARPEWRPWAAAGLSLHLGIRMSSVLTLRVLSELSANLVRDQFDTQQVVAGEPPAIVDTSPLYSPGWVALDLGVGVAYDF